MSHGLNISERQFYRPASCQANGNWRKRGVCSASGVRWRTSARARVQFKLDYVNADGEISGYLPDFFVKVSQKEIYIVETKGLEDLDVPPKMARLRQWCADINAAQSAVRYDFVFVDEEGFKKYQPKDFKTLLAAFTEYKN